MQLRKKANSGYSLVELMIAMVVSLIVLGAAVSLVTINAQFGAKQLKQDKLRAELSALAFFISNEINRAGFCFNCGETNPYLLEDLKQNRASILIDDSATKTSGSCIRFAYNQSKGQNPNTIKKNDAKGFRLGKDANGNAVIEIYENWNGLQNWHCTSAAGYSGYWQDMTLDSIVLETFQFARISSQVKENHKQMVRLQIAASIQGNSKIKEKLTLDIDVLNVDF